MGAVFLNFGNCVRVFVFGSTIATMRRGIMNLGEILEFW